MHIPRRSLLSPCFVVKTTVNRLASSLIPSYKLYSFEKSPKVSSKVTEMAVSKEGYHKCMYSWNVLELSKKTTLRCFSRDCLQTQHRIQKTLSVQKDSSNRKCFPMVCLKRNGIILTKIKLTDSR